MTDYQLTGKLYPKLDCYLVSKRPESLDVEIYMASTCQFKTMRKFKQHMLDYYGAHLILKIRKGDE